jgi:hypothetical protein
MTVEQMNEKRFDQLDEKIDKVAESIELMRKEASTDRGLLIRHDEQIISVISSLESHRKCHTSECALNHTALAESIGRKVMVWVLGGVLVVTALFITKWMISVEKATAEVHNADRTKAIQENGKRDIR